MPTIVCTILQGGILGTYMMCMRWRGVGSYVQYSGFVAYAVDPRKARMRTNARAQDPVGVDTRTRTL